MRIKYEGSAKKRTPADTFELWVDVNISFNRESLIDSVAVNGKTFTLIQIGEAVEHLIDDCVYERN